MSQQCKTKRQPKNVTNDKAKSQPPPFLDMQLNPMFSGTTLRLFAWRSRHKRHDAAAFMASLLHWLPVIASDPQWGKIPFNSRTDTGSL